MAINVTQEGTGLSIAELALDPATWDIALPPKLIRSYDAMIQRLKVRFRWFRGEWFLDEREGIPYYQYILIKNPDPILISFLFRKVLATTPGIKSIISFNAILDSPKRELAVDFKVNLVDTAVLTAVAEPFIIG